MKLADLELSLDRINNGVWWDYTTNATCEGNKPHASNPCFLVVPYVGSGFDVTFQNLLQPYYDLLRKGELPEAKRAALNGEAHAKTILRGWANLENEDGTPLPWSEAKAAELMSDRRWLVLSTFVCRAANHHAAALAKEEAQARGN